MGSSCISKVVQLRSNRKTCALCVSEEVIADILDKEEKEARWLMLNEGNLAARRVAEAMASVEKNYEIEEVV